MKAKVGIPQSWVESKIAGKQLYYGFMLRHKEFSLRTLEQTSLNRVKAFCRENVDAFFRNLDQVVHSYGDSSIWNMDETGFSTVPSKMGRKISLRGVKRVGKITSAERGSMMTLAFAVSATGNTIPPFYLFPRKNLNTTYREDVTKETVTIANENGWMTQKEFLHWMRHFIEFSGASKSAPKLLLLDNHGSHMSVDVIDLAMDNGVTILTFPPHCSHRMQLLDVTVYDQAHDNWMKRNAGNSMQIMHIPMLIRQALERGATTANTTSGFKCTGIGPFDDGIFEETDFILPEVTKQNNKYIFIENQYTEDEQRRIVFTNDDLEVAATETVCTTDESTPGTSRAASEARAASLCCIGAYVAMLDEIGPVQDAPAKKESNRGPKPGKTTILTSPENVAALKEKQQKRKAALEEKEAKQKKKQKDTPKKTSKNAKPPKQTSAKTSGAKATPKKPSSKRKLRSSSSSNAESGEQCDVCGKKFKEIPTPRNSYVCMGTGCEKIAHQACGVLNNNAIFV